MGKVAFKQCDVERALRAAKAVGFSTPTVEILADGRIRVLTGADESAALTPLQQWEKERGQRGA